MVKRARARAEGRRARRMTSPAPRCMLSAPTALRCKVLVQGEAPRSLRQEARTQWTSAPDFQRPQSYDYSSGDLVATSLSAGAHPLRSSCFDPLVNSSR
jgi:hypothetical protein